MVEHIVRFGAELQIHPLIELEALAQGHIPFLIAGSDDDAARRIAGPRYPRRYERECQRVEPRQTRSNAGFQRWLGDYVGATRGGAGAEEAEGARINTRRGDR